MPKIKNGPLVRSVAERRRHRREQGERSLLLGGRLLDGAGLLDDALDRDGRLGTDVEPLVGLFEVEGVVHAFAKRIVGSDLLDVAAVPALAAVDGQLDRLVTPDQSQDYHAALLAAGVESELYLHRWYGHFAMFLFGGDAEDKAIDFLNRHNQTS